MAFAAPCMQGQIFSADLCLQHVDNTATQIVLLVQIAQLMQIQQIQ